MQLRVSYIITAIASRLRRRRKRRTLEDLPLEVIKLIFRLACTEQSTGCALSQVSKQIRALSLSTRFHSVAILAGSTSRLRLFATTFEAVCIEAAMQNIPRPVVRHLCISSTLDYETGERFKGRVYMMCSSSGDGPTFLDRFGYHHAEYRDALATLFRRVGTSQLESLMIIGDLSLGEDGGRRAFLECLDGFPNLRELSVIGSRRPPFEWTPSAISSMAHASGPVNGPLYPTLRRLLVVPRNDIEVGFKWWAQHAPQLEELHIIARCSTQSPDMKFVPDLVTNLSKTRYGSASEGQPTFWPELNRVVFGYHAELPSNGANADPAHLNAYLAAVRKLSPVFDTLRPLVSFTTDFSLKDRCSLLLMDTGRWDNGGQVAYAFLDWADRADGGEGLSIKERTIWRMDTSTVSSWFDGSGTASRRKWLYYRHREYQ
ncbi:hypothetical protein C8Q70DRAFT_246588 [Cubamyces menziesii]|nr:hypothetical protein C8Q70DRAFT_246588 [Cubamyces menziesii]